MRENRPGSKRKPLTKVPAAWALGIVVAGTLASGALAVRQQEINRQRLQAAQERQLATVMDYAMARLENVQLGLHGVRALVATLGEHGLNRRQFRQFAEASDAARRFRGARGFGFIRRVDTAALPAFLAQARSDGAPGFTPHYLGPAGRQQYIIQYIEPDAPNSQALGLDVGSERHRREAAELAMLRGTPALTGPITLVQAENQPQQSFLMFLPVYRPGMAVGSAAERSAALLGWAYAPVQMGQVLAGLRPAELQASLRISDVTRSAAPELIFDANPGASATAVAEANVLQREVMGRQWRIEIQAAPALVAGLNLAAPINVLLGGIVASLFLAGTYLLWNQGRAHRLRVRQQQARLSAVVEFSSDAIVGEDLQGLVIFWNRAAETLFGYSEVEALGRPVSGLLLPAQGQVDECSVGDALARGQQLAAIDAQRRHRDGHMIDVAITAAPIREENGNLVGTARFFRDISERKEREQKLRDFNDHLEQVVQERTAALQAAAALLRTVLSSASEMSIIATDRDGLITIFNAGAEHLLGWTAAEVVGKMTPAAFHVAQEVAARAKALSEECGQAVEGFRAFVLVAEQKGSETRNWTYVRRDGGILPVSLVVTTMRDADGAIIGYLGIARDITEHQRVERLKDEFISTVSHELRTPMNALIGLSYLLQQTPLNGEQRQLLSKLHQSGLALLSIINDVLDYSKLEAGRMELEQRPFLLSEVLQQVTDLFSTQAQQKGLLLHSAVRAGVPDRLAGDPMRLRQVLTNLVANALKFTDAGSITISVAAAAAEPGAPVRLRFAVTDTGIGIAPEVGARLFKPFSQADATTTRRFGGTGLGLSISKRLVHMMGGEIGYDSALGRGSEFWFWLPFERSARALQGLRAQATTALDVVVVDDDRLARHMLAAPARALGWQVQELASGAELLALAEQRAQQGLELPEAIIIDWQMPGMDGLQALDALAARCGRAQLPAAIVVSSHGKQAIQQLDTGQLAAAILATPASPADLFNAMGAAWWTRYGTTARLGRATQLGNGAVRCLPDVRVLLVDDSDINLEVGRSLLESEGAQVTLAGNGLEALALLRTQGAATDVVLMDIQMPGMDGLEATCRIRAMAGLHALPILALTAGAHSEERARALAVGMDDFISKPLEPATLFVAVRLAVEKRRGQCLPVSDTVRRLGAALALPELEGINARRAALSVGDDHALFMKLLGNLLAEYDADAFAPDALAPEQRPALRARLHKLRGSAATLGADALEQAATGAELLLGSTVDDGAAELAACQAVRDALAQLRRAALRLPATHAAPPGGAPAATVALSARSWHELHTLLRRQDLAALPLCRQMMPDLQARFGDTLADQLAAAVERLDFAHALQLAEAVPIDQVPLS